MLGTMPIPIIILSTTVLSDIATQTRYWKLTMEA